MSVAEDIEILYYDLAEALALYQFRLESSSRHSCAKVIK